MPPVAAPLDFPVSWEEMHRNARALGRQLLGQAKWKGVIGVARGGLVPAMIVARELDILRVESLCISSYDHQKQGKVKVMNMPNGIDDGAGWIIVDDLVDTGNTFRAVRKMFPKAHYTAVYAKPKGLDTVDTFVTTVSQSTWIYFPWDWVSPQWNLEAAIKVPAKRQKKSGR